MMIDRGEGTAEQFNEMVGRRALELLELEGDEREERHELLKDRDFWSALEDGMPMADAWDLSEKVGQWALELVTRITASGGACGGHA